MSDVDRKFLALVIVIIKYSSKSIIQWPKR